jgi:hypothetical protein
MTTALRPELTPRGRPFAPGFDERRNITGKLNLGHCRKDLVVWLTESNPDAMIAVLEHLRTKNGELLIDVLVRRFVTRVRRPPQLGGPRYYTGGRRR